MQDFFLSSFVKYLVINTIVASEVYTTSFLFFDSTYIKNYTKDIPEKVHLVERSKL